jgi:hypothetical protein
MAYMGSGTQVAIGKESSWGSAVADTLLLPFLSESMHSTPKKVEEDNLLASKAPAAYDLVGITVGGEVSGILKPECAGFLMWAALGGTDTVTTPTGQQLHTMIAQTAAGALKSYTVFVNRKVSVIKYSGCKVQSLKLSAKAGDYVRYTVTFKSKDEATGSITTSTVPSLKSYKFIGATATFGAAALDITDLDFTIENDLDDGVQTNTSGLYASEATHKTRKFKVHVNGPAIAAFETIRTTNANAETLLSTVVIHLESPSLIATTYKYRMDITLNNVAVMDVTGNIGGKDLLTQGIDCEATAVGATEPISVALYDGTATAYSA